jgi:PAS domain S-box-containing protein
MTTPAQSPSETTRESIAPLLLRRFRLMMPVILGTTGIFALVHVWLGEANLGLLMGLKGLQLTTAVLAFAVSSRFPRRIVIVTSLVVLASSVNLITAATGAIIGNTNTNALLFAVVSLATSSFLPWGFRAQAVSAASAALAAIAPPLLGVPLYPDIWYDFAALGAAFAISCYIAREVESDTLAEHRAQTAIQALADSRATFEAVFQSSIVSLGLFEARDDDFVFLAANDFLAAIFRMTPEQIAGKTGREVGFPDTEIARWLDVFRRCAETGSVRLPEYRFVIHPPERWYEVSISSIGDREAGRVSVAAIDITERKRAADDVERLNRELEAKVQERTSLLAAANKDLESFAYSVSHDLRTPLRSIEGFATLLADDHAGELSGSATAQLGRIRAASRHMAQLIDDMLTLSRVVRGEVGREKVDLSAIARETAAELAARSPERDVRVSIEDGIVAIGDPRLLRIVISNLLTNAWKYTGRRAVAHIEVGGAVEGGEVVCFVRDDGCGFDKRFGDKLFRPFQRLHSPEEYEGTGIGLATVARIVQRHHGRVWADGEVDRGATFSFALPLHAALDQADTGAAEPGVTS